MNKILGILLFSVIEVIGLVGWLALSDAQLGFLDIFGLIGIIVLFAGLFVEHVVTDNVLHKRKLFNFSGLPIGEIAGFSAIETTIWVVWLVLATINPIVAFVFLFVSLFFEHSISKNVHERDGIFSQVFDKTTLPHTAVETVACTVWLVLARTASPILAVVVLLVGSIVEHIIAIRGTTVGE